MKAESLILEYWQIQKEIFSLTKQIKSEYVLDTQPVEDGNEESCTSNHVHDYFEADKKWRSLEGYSMEFSEYCCDVLGMNDVCQICAHVLELIRKRKELRRKLGYTKGKITRLGKQIEIHMKQHRHKEAKP